MWFLNNFKVTCAPSESFWRSEASKSTQLTTMAAPHFIMLQPGVSFDDHWSTTRIVFFFLHIFCEGNLDMMAALTAAPGADLAVKNNAGNTPLHIAAKEGDIWSSSKSNSLQHIFEGKAEVAGLLIRAPGADLTIKNNAGKTAEQLARCSLKGSQILQHSQQILW